MREYDCRPADSCGTQLAKRLESLQRHNSSVLSVLPTRGSTKRAELNTKAII